MLSKVVRDGTKWLNTFVSFVHKKHSQKQDRYKFRATCSHFLNLDFLVQVLRALENDAEYEELEVPCLLNSADAIGQRPSISFNLNWQTWQDNEIEEVMDGGVLESKTELESTR